MLETMTSTPEPDDRRAAPDQTADDGAADTGDAIVRPENATSDRPDDPAPGAADGRSEDVVVEADDHVDAADVAHSAEVPDAICPRRCNPRHGIVGRHGRVVGRHGGVVG